MSSTSGLHGAVRAEWSVPSWTSSPARVGDDVKFVKVNIDENQELAVRYGVMSIPTIAKFVGGAMAAQVVGARGADALGRELGIES